MVTADGTALQIEGEGEAVVTYGAWDDRTGDVTRTVTLPALIEPGADGFDPGPGAWFVIRVDPREAQPAIIAQAVTPSP